MVAETTLRTLGYAPCRGLSGDADIATFFVPTYIVDEVPRSLWSFRRAT